MTVYRKPIQIKQSLLRKIEQLSNGKEDLTIIIQIEDHDDGTFDTVTLLSSKGVLLLDETYTVGQTEQDAKIDATFLLNSVKRWMEKEGTGVVVNSKIKEVCF